ncbi:MAG: hypothetical protein ABFS42_03480 [Candidatus Krumholzibacteriota bacterium]
MVATESHVGLKSTSELDALDRSRRHMLIAVVATSTLWLVPQILRSAFDEGLPQVLNIALIVAGVVGALAYVFFMLRFHRFQKRILGDPGLRERLDDERVLILRKEAIYRGWVILVLAVGLGVAVAPFADLPDQAILLTLMLLAVNSPILFFLVLDRG